jgi:hypothetical protein
MPQKLPANFKRIRMELAREPGHPEGDRRTAYVLIAPIGPDGKLDAEAFKAHADACTVVRMRPGEDPEEGRLRRRPGGSWAFHYDFADGGEDDDPGYRLGDHVFAAGEYVTINEDEGPHTYRIAWVQEP